MNPIKIKQFVFPIVLHQVAAILFGTAMLRWMVSEWQLFSQSAALISLFLAASISLYLALRSRWQYLDSWWSVGLQTKPYMYICAASGLSVAGISYAIQKIQQVRQQDWISISSVGAKTDLNSKDFYQIQHYKLDTAAYGVQTEFKTLQRSSRFIAERVQTTLVFPLDCTKSDSTTTAAYWLATTYYEEIKHPIPNAEKEQLAAQLTQYYIQQLPTDYPQLNMLRYLPANIAQQNQLSVFKAVHQSKCFDATRLKGFFSPEGAVSFAEYRNNLFYQYFNWIWMFGLPVLLSPFFFKWTGTSQTRSL